METGLDVVGTPVTSHSRGRGRKGVTSRPLWATEQDFVSKHNNQTEQTMKTRAGVAPGTEPLPSCARLRALPPSTGLGERKEGAGGREGVETISEDGDGVG